MNVDDSKPFSFDPDEFKGRLYIHRENCTVRNTVTVSSRSSTFFQTWATHAYATQLEHASQCIYYYMVCVRNLDLNAVLLYRDFPVMTFLRSILHDGPHFNTHRRRRLSNQTLRVPFCITCVWVASTVTCYMFNPFPVIFLCFVIRLFTCYHYISKHSPVSLYVCGHFSIIVNGGILVCFPTSYKCFCWWLTSDKTETRLSLFYARTEWVCVIIGVRLGIVLNFSCCTVMLAITVIGSNVSLVRWTCRILPSSGPPDQ